MEGRFDSGPCRGHAHDFGPGPAPDRLLALCQHPARPGEYVLRGQGGSVRADGPPAARRAEYAWVPAEELSREEDAVLRATVELTRQLPEDHAPSTREVAVRAAELLRADGEAFSFSGGAPWWGIKDPVQGLEDRGLLRQENNVATFVAPGQPTPAVESYPLVIEDSQDAARATGWSAEERPI